MKIKEKKTINEVKTIYYEDGLHIYEQIYDPFHEQPLRFIELNKMTMEFDYVPNFAANGKLYLPDDSEYILRNKVLFPSDVVDTSEKNIDEAIKEYINFYYYINEKSTFFANLYIKYSWIYDQYSITPYLRVSGDPGSGKSRFIKTIGLLCQRPHLISGTATESVIFRTLDQYKPTLVVNEFDILNSDDKNLMTVILNNGFEKGMPVPRMEGEGKNMHQRVFEVYGPKILSTIEKFKSYALESRIINLDPTDLPIKERNKYPVIVWEEEMQEWATRIRNMLLCYRLKWLASQKRTNPRTMFDYVPITTRNLETENILSGRNNFKLVRVMRVKNPDRAGKEKSFDKFLEDIELSNRTRQTLYPLLYLLPEDKIDIFIGYAKEYQKELLEKIKDDLIGIFASTIIKLYQLHNNEVTVAVLRKTIQEDTGIDKLYSQTIGAILRRLKINRENRGHENTKYLILNDDIIKKLSDKYESPSLPVSPDNDSHDSQTKVLEHKDSENTMRVENTEKIV